MLVALVARVDAAPADASSARAVRHAGVLVDAGAPDDRDDHDDHDDHDDRDDRDDGDAGAEDASEAGESGDADTDDAREAGDADTEDAREAGDPEDPGDTGGLDDADATDAADDTRGDDLDGAGAADQEFADAGDLAPGSVELAMQEAEQAPAWQLSDDARLAAAPAGAPETYEASVRHPRLARWGRLDLGMAWRRLWSLPMHAQPHRSDELWLVATWRR